MRWQALVLSSVLIGGCATITKGSMQSVSINTPHVVGAVCTLSSPSIGNRTITAPNTISIEKASYNIDVHCKKECYEDGVASGAYAIYQKWHFAGRNLHLRLQEFLQREEKRLRSADQELDKSAQRPGPARPFQSPPTS